MTKTRFGIRQIRKKTPRYILAIGYSLSSLTALAAEYGVAGDPTFKKILFCAAFVLVFITHMFHLPGLNDRRK